MEDLVQMTESSIVPAFREQGKVRVLEKVFIDEIPGLQDNSGCETLTSLKAVGQGSVYLMPCDTPVFQDWADNGKIKDTTGANGSTGEGPMDKTNNAASFFYIYGRCKETRRGCQTVRNS